MDRVRRYHPNTSREGTGTVPSPYHHRRTVFRDLLLVGTHGEGISSVATVKARGRGWTNVGAIASWYFSDLAVGFLWKLNDQTMRHDNTRRKRVPILAAV